MTRASGSTPLSAATLLLTPIGLLYVLFLIAPISYFLAVSFLKYSPQLLYTSEPTLENYGRLLFDPFYTHIIFNTFRISATVTLVTVVLSYAIAFQLSRVASAWRGILIFLVVA